MSTADWSIHKALANVEARDDEIAVLEANIEDMNGVISDQREELQALVRFIKKFNHPEEYGHLLDADAKQAVMKILAIYKEYDE